MHPGIWRSQKRATRPEHRTTVDATDDATERDRIDRRPMMENIARRFVTTLAIGVGMGLWLWLGFPSVAAAIASPANQGMVTEVSVHLGTPAGELTFVPDHLQFEAGKRYKLILDNPSPEKHYFTAKDFADGIWTQKVEAGKVEVKGAIHELELKPGALAEWVFVPERSGTYPLRCTIAGHTEAGMVGEIAIAP
ncbi:biphenyl 2,3-dioxygenase [Leptolyngbya sp. AN02str]|uniref:biphenyl 2,3-dioxygenase n=1 Tax=Leptolyngbya sp. AN02str TaxID=3423363 RepID=UPI003D31CE3A